MTKISKTSFSKTLGALALAATALISVGTAEAKNGRNAALIGGLIGGAVLGAALSGGPSYGHGYYEDDYYAPVRRRQCWRERRVVGEDYYGEPIIRRVRVCSR